MLGLGLVVYQINKFLSEDTGPAVTVVKKSVVSTGGVLLVLGVVLVVFGYYELIKEMKRKRKRRKKKPRPIIPIKLDDEESES